jgi:hypothetical protein
MWGAARAQVEGEGVRLTRNLAPTINTTPTY